MDECSYANCKRTELFGSDDVVFVVQFKKNDRMSAPPNRSATTAKRAAAGQQQQQQQQQQQHVVASAVKVAITEPDSRIRHRRLMCLCLRLCMCRFWRVQNVYNISSLNLAENRLYSKGAKHIAEAIKGHVSALRLVKFVQDCEELLETAERVHAQKEYNWHHNLTEVMTDLCNLKGRVQKATEAIFEIQKQHLDSSTEQNGSSSQ